MDRSIVSENVVTKVVEPAVNVGAVDAERERACRVVGEVLDERGFNSVSFLC